MKIGKPLKKSENRFRKRKAVSESGKPLKKSESRWRRFSRISRKWESRWRKSIFEQGKLNLTRGFRRDYLVTYFGSWIKDRGTWILDPKIAEHGSRIHVPRNMDLDGSTLAILTFEDHFSPHNFTDMWFCRWNSSLTNLTSAFVTVN